MQMLDLALFDTLADLGRWSFESFWLPLLVWTAVALPAYLFVKLNDRLTPHVRYWTLVALVFSLPLGLAAAALAFLRPAAVEHITFVAVPALITVAPVAEGAEAISWTVWHTAGAALLVAVLLAIWRGGMLALGFAALRRYRDASGQSLPWLERQTNDIARTLGIRRPVSVSLRNTSSPFTIGWLRPHVVLPSDLVGSEDLHFALTHELIHIRRRDFAVQLFEQAVGALFFFHPLVWLIRRDTSVLREITCDADVIARTGDRSTYARLLYRYSSVTASPNGLAVGIFSKNHQLTHRISAMKNFLSNHGINRSKQAGIAVFTSLLVVAVLFVACSDALVDSGPASTEEAMARTEAEADIFVVVEDMPELIGGLASIQEQLVYPDLARKAGVEGRVIIQFIVDEEGAVVDPEIVRGVGSGLDAAALEAVRTAEFKPGMQRGKAVPVKMSLPVTFRLGDEAARSPGVADSPSVDAASADPTADVELPRIEGGLTSIVERLQYPETAKRAGVEGRVLVGFTVDEDGRVQDAYIKEGLGSGLDEAALRAVRATTFTPATKKGVPVAVTMTLPVTFKLPETETTETSDVELIRTPMNVESLQRTDGMVTGRVVADSGTPVAGANIVLAGTRTGAVTNGAGEFTMTLPKDYATGGTIRISHVAHGSTGTTFR